MHEQYSIPLSDLIKEFKLETVYLPGDPEELMISNPEVHRPGLALTGFDGLINFEISTGRIPASARPAFAQYLISVAHELMTYIE